MTTEHCGTIGAAAISMLHTGKMICGRRVIPLTPNMVGASLAVEFAAWMLRKPVRTEQLHADRVEHFLG